MSPTRVLVGCHFLKPIREIGGLIFHRTTPIILLICKGITHEAMMCLRKKPLVFSTPLQTCRLHHHYYRTFDFIDCFISHHTLRSIARLEFNMPGALTISLCPVGTTYTTPARESLLAWIDMIQAIFRILQTSSAIQELCLQIQNHDDDTFPFRNLVKRKEGKFIIKNRASILKFVSH